MRVLCAACFLLATLTAAQAEAQTQDCALKRIASLDMTALPDGRFTIPVMMNDSPRAVMPDTGSPIGELNEALAHELNLTERKILEAQDVYSDNGDRADHFANLPSLKIGPDEARYTQFIIGKWTHAPFDGILGSDILRNFDVDLDFAANKFNLFSQDHCAGKVVYWAGSYTDTPATIAHDGHIHVIMSLDGHDVDAIIDTGATWTVLNATDARQLFGIDASSPGMESIPDVDGMKAYRYRFKSLSLAGVAMPSPHIIIIPDGAALASDRSLRANRQETYQQDTIVRSPPLVLGMDVLRHLHLYIAYKEQKIYATAADAH
ncbi:MAG TPA: retroviral-like aspartic protease family protein [Rhizomicrobium sp.]|jgi:predicted aspartyl protease